ncbi:HypC/HybG/HupF family hydrogenase formation chaperone [Methanospirillum sp. J.3.6.1-F.2.7.3]|jgi:hydrogenase expression/formation protein HypC|uniref:HypC/HybG/HupF family hydrogenase formation chaperone n=2 Tax=Methanospirillum TaxID=2202 RepID=A0A8E7B4H8_9EURY|nr:MULTISPECIES: HypC/HybG/HupF family hydrogenase formation chaperone [Methanospirillum]MDX8550720.1 HypC/HybG/HupF family hydrogenase formation chaperone [Methanospirillum hungatei]NLW77014.1 HypC/HybG/HupF family hydrogenase formation chaperone [Methanomicrobiales archaeon]QVV90276.1 HypC/HybG/HupF family hydrogenase formation chaperone [Methanospirillum sp. J.3.6.1-F.2.7.3]QXO94664.1 HypC/HybG/HupF family hydrogenase formation chaperone [Methanospirillum hungatei]
MCIAIPAEIIEIRNDNTALVDFGSLRQDIRIDLVDVAVGDFVLVHVGFAIQKVNRDEALETRELFRQCYAAMEETA